MSTARFATGIAGATTMYFYSKHETSMLRPKTASLDAEVETRRAICILDSQPNQTGKGIVRFEQKGQFSSTKIHGEFSGLKPSHKHGFHIHEFGDLTNGCITAGKHYNPFGQTHGGPEEKIRHIGDLGNVQSDADGKGLYEHEDKLI